MPTEQARVELSEAHDGKVARLVLAGPSDNGLDLTLVDELQRAVNAVARWPQLTAVVIEGAGAHFSTGHPELQLAPPYAGALIEGFHAALRALLGLDALLVSLVRGRCQGAGVSLALVADIVVADNTTRFKLCDETEATPPLTTLLVAERLDRAHAAQVLLSTKILTGEEAATLQLVSDYAGGWENAAAVADRHIRQLVLNRSPPEVRNITRTLHDRLLTRVAESLPELERAFVDRLSRRGAGESDARTLSPKWKPG